MLIIINNVKKKKNLKIEFFYFLLPQILNAPLPGPCTFGEHRVEDEGGKFGHLQLPTKATVLISKSSHPLLNRGGIFSLLWGAKFLNATRPPDSPVCFRLHAGSWPKSPCIPVALAQDEPLPARAININNCTAEIRAYIMYYTYREGAGVRSSVSP